MGALIISVAEPQSRSPKGQTHTIYKSGLFYLATIIREGGRAGAGRVTYCKEGEEGRQAAVMAVDVTPAPPPQKERRGNTLSVTFGGGGDSGTMIKVDRAGLGRRRRRAVLQINFSLATVRDRQTALWLLKVLRRI